jgi:phage-related protein
VGSAQRAAEPTHRTLLFFVGERRIGAVHGFIKKEQKTPSEDLQLARRRMKEMQA